jgi:CrcB protein
MRNQTRQQAHSARPHTTQQKPDDGREDSVKYLVIGLGGFIGANTRFIVGQWAAQKWGTAFPYGTFLINITGSFILGLFATLLLHFAWNDYWRLLIAIGFVGAYTTFSTFEYETLQLVAQGSWTRAMMNALGSLVCGFAAAYTGVIIVRLLTRGYAN